MTYFNKPSDLAPVTKARSVDINNLAALIAAAFGKLPDELDLKMGTVNYAVNTGPNGAAYSVVMATAIKAYADGLEVKMRPVRDNTGACTLNVNGLGAIAIKRADGTDPQAGDILGNTPITLTYQSTGNVFRLPAVVNSQIIQAAGASASASASAAAAAASAATALKTLAWESVDPPADPLEGQEWIDAATGRRFTFVEGQWAETYAAQVVDQPTLVDQLRTELALIGTSKMGTVGDGIADDTAALKAAIRAVAPYADTYPNLAALTAALGSIKPQRVRINGQCRVTQTVFLPAGVILESGSFYFTRQAKHGIFYDPADLNTVAVSALVYKKQLDNSYAIYNDLSYIPSGTDFDSGAYVAASTNAQLNCAVVTKAGVKLGVAFIGAAGCSTNGLSIGENTDATANARMPKVGLLQAAAWGAVHNTPHILARIQGVVLKGSNGGSVFNQAYIDRNGSDNNDTDVPLFISGYAKTGSIGVTLDNCNDVTFNSPIVEHWCTPFALNLSVATVNTPHIEAYGGRIRHCFAVVASRLTVNDASAMAAGLDATSSLFWIQDCTVNHSVLVKGQLPTSGYPFVTGQNSVAVLEIERLNRAQAQYGSVGDASLIHRFSYENVQNGYPFIQVGTAGAAIGDDKNWGLHSAMPVASPNEAAKRIRALGGKGSMQLISNVTANANIDLARIEDFSLVTGAYTLTLAAGIYFQIGAGRIRFSMAAGTLSAPGSTAPWQFASSGVLHLFLTAGAAITSSYSLVSFGANGIGLVGRAEIMVNGANIAGLTRYANGGTGNYGVVTLGICTPNRNTAIDATPVANSVAVAFADFRNS